MPDANTKLNDLRQRRDKAKQDAAEKLKALKDAEREQLNAIDQRIRRAESRLRAQQKRKENHRLYVIGCYAEERAAADPDFKAELDNLLDLQLTRPADRELFGLPPRTTLTHLRAKFRSLQLSILRRMSALTTKMDRNGN